MKRRFERNDAAGWLRRVFVIYAAFLAASVFIVLLADPQRLWLLLTTGPSTLMTLALNGVIGVTFLLGLVLILAWLLRASREEAAVLRAWRDNFAEGERPRSARQVDLSAVRESAVRDRIEMLGDVGASGGALDPGSLSEALVEQEEPRVAVARYAAGVLVLLGLLGTFVGLLVTIAGVSEVVASLSVSPEEDLEAFMVQLKEGLRSPLAGMAVAFSTSLLGLAGSLVLGAGALGLSAAQASWMSKLEELSALATAWSLPSQAVMPAGAQPVRVEAAPAPVADPRESRRLEATAHLLAGSQERSGEHLARLDGVAGRVAGSVADLRDTVASLGAQYERLETVLTRLAEGQDRGREGLNDVAVKLAELAGVAGAIRSDVRDGSAELSGRLETALTGLRDGTARALADLGQSVDADPEGVRRALEALAGRVEQLQAGAHADAVRQAELLEAVRVAIDDGHAPPEPPRGPAGLPVRGGGRPDGGAR